MPPDHNPEPTPYPEVNAVLHELQTGIEQTLGERLVGLYLHGSLAGGQFNPHSSDIDFLAVTTEALPEESLSALKAMHARLTLSGLKWAAKMEGSYIPRAELRDFDPAHSYFPALRADGTFTIDGHGHEWTIQRYIVREMGVVLFGPDPRSLIDPIGPDDLRRAVTGLVHDWWAPMLADPHLLLTREYQAYAALTMARMFYTLEHGTIVPKPAAAQWARQLQGGRWASLIDQALAWPAGPQPDRLTETMEMIRAAVAHSEQ